MFYSTLATLLMTSTLATAAPTLTTRSCQTAYPASLGFPINYDIHQDANGANARTDALTFTNIPPGSYGCQLEVIFPANYPITSSGASAINVIATSGAQETLFGTVALQSSPVRDTTFVVNSAVCSQGMSYRLEIASETAAGSVQFAEVQGAGFVMVYDC